MLPRVLICGEIVWAHDEVKELFGSIAEVIKIDSSDRKEFLAGLAPGGKYHGIVGVYRDNTSSDYIGLFDSEIIGALSPSVKWIAHNGAGYDQIDVQACKIHGIKVSNTPGAVDDATATTALYLIISTIRQFSFSERSLRAGTWKPPTTAASSHDPTGRTIAILGLGGIGLRLAHLVHAFPMRVIYHSRHRVPNAPQWCEYYDDVEKMLSEADILSIHVPLRKDTEGLVGEKWIRKLKKGAIVINTARGKIIDEMAVVRALEDGHISSVGLDVYPDEPNVNPRLIAFPQNTLLPHMGTETQDSQRKMEVRALTNLRDFLKRGSGSDVILEHR